MEDHVTSALTNDVTLFARAGDACVTTYFSMYPSVDVDSVVWLF